MLFQKSVKACQCLYQEQDIPLANVALYIVEIQPPAILENEAHHRSRQAKVTKPTELVSGRDIQQTLKPHEEVKYNIPHLLFSSSFLLSPCVL